MEATTELPSAPVFLKGVEPQKKVVPRNQGWVSWLHSSKCQRPREKSWAIKMTQIDSAVTYRFLGRSSSFTGCSLKISESSNKRKNTELCAVYLSLLPEYPIYTSFPREVLSGNTFQLSKLKARLCLPGNSKWAAFMGPLSLWSLTPKVNKSVCNYPPYLLWQTLVGRLLSLHIIKI